MIAQDLRGACLDLRVAALDGAKWVGDNSALVGSPETLMKHLRQYARQLNNYAEAAERKMGVAVFGPSQAGKSTLISALCKGPGGFLNALFSDVSLDFLREINPEGGNETTGLVTRFSLDPYPQSPDPSGHPVCLRLFSEMDIVKILANTYFAEAEGDSLLSDEDISRKLEALEGRSGGRSRLSLDDLEDLSEYVQNLAKKSAYGRSLESVYWGRALPLGEKLGLDDRAELFACLWGGLPPFTEVYKRLYRALESLDFTETAFCELAALYDKDAADYGRGKSIIIVDQLNGLLDDQAAEAKASPVSVINTEGQGTKLSRPLLSALIAELHVKVKEKPGPFMDRADILDFPGYRAREKFKDISIDIQKPENLKTCFLRGKVAYLFERYSERKEITSMLLCIGNSVQNNPDLPHVIKPWLENAHGLSEVERAGKPMALFLVLTMFDGTIEQGGGSTETTTRWENRLKASFLDFFGMHDWPKKWALENGGMKPFNNIYWLQDLSYAHSFLDVEAIDIDGTRQNYRSRGLKPDRAAWAQDVLEGYLSCQPVREYIREPQAAWDAIMKEADGGVGYLTRHLSPILTEDLKSNQLIQLALAAADKINQMLRPFYFGANKDEERSKKEKQSFALIKALNVMMNANQRFGQLLRALQLSDTDCQAIYNRPLPAQEPADLSSPPVEESQAAAQADSFDLDDLFASPAAEAPGTASSTQPVSTINDDAAHRFRRRVELAWQERLDEVAANRRLQLYYLLNKDLLHSLTVELSQGARRLKVFDRLETRLREAINYSNANPDQTIWKQSRLAAADLSAFISWLGLSPVELKQPERTVTIQNKEVTLFEPSSPPELFPELPDEQIRYDLPYFQDWCRALMRLMLHNVDFADQMYNRKENDRLGAILKRLEAAERPFK